MDLTVIIFSKCAAKSKLLYLFFANDAATIGQHMFFNNYVVVPGIEMIVCHLGFAPLSLVLQKQNDNWYFRLLTFKNI